jgi:hypothetical protein
MSCNSNTTVSQSNSPPKPDNVSRSTVNNLLGEGLQPRSYWDLLVSRDTSGDLFIGTREEARKLESLNQYHGRSEDVALEIGSFRSTAIVLYNAKPRRRGLFLHHDCLTCPSAGLFLVHHLLIATSTSARPGPNTARVREKARIMVMVECVFWHQQAVQILIVGVLRQRLINGDQTDFHLFYLYRPHWGGLRNVLYIPTVLPSGRMKT